MGVLGKYVVLGLLFILFFIATFFSGTNVIRIEKSGLIGKRVVLDIPLAMWSDNIDEYKIGIDPWLSPIRETKTIINIHNPAKSNAGSNAIRFTYVPKQSTFTITEEYISKPYGIEKAFSSTVNFMVVENRLGEKAIMLSELPALVREYPSQFENNYKALFDEAEKLESIEVDISLQEQAEASASESAENRAARVSSAQAEFMKKIPGLAGFKVIEFDKYHSRIFAQINSDALLYMYAAQSRLRIKNICRYYR